MTNDYVLYAYRLRVLVTARELGSVAAACRIHSIHRSAYYRWKGMVDRFGREILCPRERRAPQMRVRPRASGQGSRRDLVRTRT